MKRHSLICGFIISTLLTGCVVSDDPALNTMATIGAVGAASTLLYYSINDGYYYDYDYRRLPRHYRPAPNARIQRINYVPTQHQRYSNWSARPVHNNTVIINNNRIQPQAPNINRNQPALRTTTRPTVRPNINNNRIQPQAPRINNNNIRPQVPNINRNQPTLRTTTRPTVRTNRPFPSRNARPAPMMKHR